MTFKTFRLCGLGHKPDDKTLVGLLGSLGVKIHSALEKEERNNIDLYSWDDTSKLCAQIWDSFRQVTNAFSELEEDFERYER